MKNKEKQSKSFFIERTNQLFPYNDGNVQITEFSLKLRINGKWMIAKEPEYGFLNVILNPGDKFCFKYELENPEDHKITTPISLQENTVNIELK